MSTKHTPSPWTADLSVSPTIWGKTKAGMMKIADIRGWGHLIGTGGLNLPEKEAIEIQEANARLMAAAPELLNALRWSINHPDECLGDHPELLEVATALLAKAEDGA